MCFAMHYLLSFYFYIHLAEEERAGCFTLIVLLLLGVFGAMCIFLTVSWVGHQYVIETETEF